MKKRKKEKKKKLNAYKIVGVLLIISSLILLGVVLYINILPIKYLAVVAGVLFLINLILNFFLFRKKVKKKPKKISTIFALLFSIIFLVASFFIFKTFGILEDMSEEYKTYTYHVLVKNDSNYQEIGDISGKSLGYYNNNSNATKKAIEKLGKTVQTENESYGNLDSLGTSLLNNETESILVEESQKTKLDNAGSSNESSSLSSFKDQTRILYTFKVTVKVESKDVDVTKDVFNIYISGMDEYGEVSEISRSDVNIIITINPKTKQILMTNIPRDYYVQLHDTSGYKDKLTHAGNYGIETSVATIEDLLGIEINYYFKVNFSSLVNIIDALGGVEVYSEYDFQSYNGYNFSKGYNSVDGKAGLSFVRERKTFADGDNQRGKNQQAMIEAIFRKCTSPSIITKYNSLLNSLKDSMITNMPMKSITKLAKMQLKDNASWTLTSNSLTGTGSYDYTYTYPYQELYVTVPDEESISKAKEMISKVTNGEKLESSYNGDASNIHSVTKSNVSKNSIANSSSSSTKTTTKKSSSITKKKSSTIKKSDSNTTSNSSSNDSNPDNNSNEINDPSNSNSNINSDTDNKDQKNPEDGGIAKDPVTPPSSDEETNSNPS
ncbi:MAG: LCP family protein [Bacilli bacterium]